MNSLNACCKMILGYLSFCLAINSLKMHLKIIFITMSVNWGPGLQLFYTIIHTEGGLSEEQTLINAGRLLTYPTADSVVQDLV